MDTVLAWMLFGFVVWLAMAAQTREKEIGKGRVPGPVWCIAALWQEAREAHQAASEDTESDGEGVDTTPDTGQKGSRRVDKPQDTTPDTGQDTPRTSPLQRVRQAAEQVRGATVGATEAVSDVPVPAPPPEPSPTVTDPGRGQPVPVAAVQPRVIVQHVPPGAWTGAVHATGADGNAVILRYEHAATLAAPTDDLDRPPVDDEDDEDEPRALTEVNLRRDWLATLDADRRFTQDEIAAMYRVKWGRGPKTLKRDRDANRALTTR